MTSLQERIEECRCLLDLSLAEDWENTHWERAVAAHGDIGKGGRVTNERGALHQYHSDEADKHRKAAQKHANTELFPAKPSDRKGPAEWKTPSSERKGKRHLKLVRAHQRVADKNAPFEDAPRKGAVRWDTVSDQ